VGDISFQLKSFDRMMEIRAAGTTILVVTHNLNAVRTLCERTVVLERGAQLFDGATPEAISLFHDLMQEPREIDDSYDTGDEDGLPMEQGVVDIESATLLDADGLPSSNLAAGSRATLRVVVHAHRDVEDLTFGLAMANERSVIVYSDNNRKFGGIERLAAGQRCEIDVEFDVSLVTGTYGLRCSLVDSTLTTKLARSRPVQFYVSGRSFVHGIADLDASFALRSVDGGALVAPEPEAGRPPEPEAAAEPEPEAAAEPEPEPEAPRPPEPVVFEGD
jgi:hypothetical protein